MGDGDGLIPRGENIPDIFASPFGWAQEYGTGHHQLHQRAQGGTCLATPLPAVTLLSRDMIQAMSRGLTEPLPALNTIPDPGDTELLRGIRFFTLAQEKLTAAERDFWPKSLAAHQDTWHRPPAPCPPPWAYLCPRVL